MGLEVKEYKQTVRTTDVVVIFDDEKNINWFIAIEYLNSQFQNAREMMNYEYFKEQGADYMQKVYHLADITITNS